VSSPNAFGGTQVLGPVLEAKFASGVGRLAIPQVYGMTVGELATMFNNHFLPLQQPSIKPIQLTVVYMNGWSRGMHYEATEMPWVPPSPNVPTIDSAWAYLGFGYFEGTNCSTGRGTTRPFEVILFRIYCTP
jgi:uncharacterized protein YbbC (DUF1343 family)